MVCSEPDISLHNALSAVQIVYVRSMEHVSIASLAFSCHSVISHQIQSTLRWSLARDATICFLLSL